MAPSINFMKATKRIGQIRCFFFALVLAQPLEFSVFAFESGETSRLSVRWIVELRVAPDAAMLKKLSSLKGVAKVERFDSYDSDYFRRLYSVEGFDLKSQLAKIPDILRVEGVHSVELLETSTPSNRGLVGAGPEAQWGLENQGQSVLHDLSDVAIERIDGVRGNDIGLKEVREQVDERMRREVVVAVLDSGLDLDHPAMKSSISKNLVECTPEGRLPFKPTVDKDGNGYVGDCMGWNFTSADLNGDPKTYDDLGHGTHVAGIIALDSDNSLGLRSLSKKIKVMPVKVITAQRENSTVVMGTITDRVAKGILYAVKRRVDVINLSLGWPKSLNTEYLKQAIRVAQENGIVVVAAAGNNNHDDPGFPCQFSGVVCVGSIDVDGQVSRFSNFGGQVDLLAPGDWILSLLPTKLVPKNTSINGFEFKNGTSQAAPFVAAIAAVLKGLDPAAVSGEQTPLAREANRTVVARLLASARDANSPSKPTLRGLVRLDRAMNSISDASVVPEFSSLPTVYYQHSSREFRGILNLEARAFGDVDRPVKVSVDLDLKSISGNGIALRQTHFEFSANEWVDSFQVSVAGTVADESIDSHLTLGVTLSTEFETAALRTSHYVGQLDLVRKLDDSERQNGRHSLIRGEVQAASLTSFNTVIDRFGQFDFPEYYTVKPLLGANPGLQVMVFKKTGPGVYSELPQAFELPLATAVLRVERVDVDLDGRADYWITSAAQEPVVQVAVPSSVPSAVSGKRFMLFSFFDSNAMPLFGPARSHWRYLPELAPIDPHQLSLVSGKAKGTEPVILFSSVGKMPALDQNPNTLEDLETWSDRHLYYLEPSLLSNTNSWVTLQARALDSFRFKKALKNRLHFAYGDGVRVVALIPPTLTSWGNRKAWAVLTAGRTDHEKQFLLPIDSVSSIEEGLQQMISIDSEGLSFSSFSLFSYAGLNRSSDSISFPDGVDFVGFDGDDNAIQSRLGFQSFSQPTQSHLPAVSVQPHYFRSPDRRDPLFGFIRGFETDAGEEYRFFQSRYQMHLWKVSRETQVEKIYSRPIHRYSFLTGTVFNDLFFPVISTSSVGQLEPSLYVDASQILGDQLSVFSIESEALRSKAFDTIQIPEGCTPLNPVRFGKSAVSYFVFLCQKDKSQWLETIKM